ncbi:MAG: MBOAT family protein [Ruminococcaceae bacterium]|nr:MBOAT family protein [Oscillospiraceae bacterium]
MVFSNLLFVFAFFPLCMLFYALARGIRAKNFVLLIFSLMFYAWGEPLYVLLLVTMAFFDWLFARLIERDSGCRRSKLWLILTCVVDLGLLGVFKYGTFTLTNLQALTGFPAIVPQILLPIGISFYTFQLLSYVVDVYRGEVAAQRSFFRLLLYVSLFHQCIAGPIVRYSQVAEELLLRRVSASDVSAGITRFTVGLGKKVLLANTCAVIADKYFPADGLTATAAEISAAADVLASQPVSLLWLGALAYMLQIYLDFSAYSDMAIGMGRMIGFHYLENFDYPYLSRSVTEFWRRWHMSLGTFFRDYVYIPLGGSRRGIWRTLRNLLIVWALTGLWHGASWNFVLWGLYYFVFLVLEKLFLKRLLARIPSVFSWLYTTAVVFFGWILFRFRSLSLVWLAICGLFGQNANPFTTFEAGTVWLNYAFFLPIAVMGVTPLVRWLNTRLHNAAPVNRGARIALNTAQVLCPVLLLLLSTFALVGNSYNPFLYFQF